MTASLNQPAAIAPPAHPVLSALVNTAVCDNLARQARALLGSRDGVRGIDIDDVLQKTKHRAIERHESFDGSGRPVGPWLYGVLVNVVREEVRAASRQPAQQPADPTLWEKAAVAPPPRDVDTAADRSLVIQHLTRLSPDHRAIVRLRILDGLGLREIADRLGISHVAARMRFSRAMRHLQALAGASPKEERP